MNKEIINKLIGYERDIILLEENPINKGCKTFISNRRRSYFSNCDILVFVGKNTNASNFKFYLRRNIRSVTEPMTLVNQDPNDDVFINLEFSTINKAFFYLKTYFFNDVAKNNYKKFILFHELGHTSTFQRGEDEYVLKDVFEKEAHSDFFALYFTLKDIDKSEHLLFLNSYMKIRKSRFNSPPDLYSEYLSNKLYQFFIENSKNMDFNKTYSDVDKISYDEIIKLRN